MRIGHYVSVVSGQKGFENNVSGHIQVPLHAMRLLRDAGHEVHLITNRFGPERSLPNCLPEGVPVHLVDDARDRGGILERTSGQKGGVRLLTLLRQARQIRDIAHQSRFDVLHVHGFNRTAYLAGGLKMLGLRPPAVATVRNRVFSPADAASRGPDSACAAVPPAARAPPPPHRCG